MSHLQQFHITCSKNNRNKNNTIKKGLQFLSGVQQCNAHIWYKVRDDNANFVLYQTSSV